MAEDKKEKTLKDKLNYPYQILSYAQIADDYLKRRDEQGILMAKKTIETLLDEAKVSDPSIRNVLSDPEVLSKTIDSQLDTYNKYKADETIGDLINYHSKTLDKYVGGGIKKVWEDLKGFAGQKYKDIKKKIAELTYVIKGIEVGKTSEEDAEKAEKELQKYKKVLMTIDSPDTLKLSEFKRKVEESAIKDNYKLLYPKKEDGKERKSNSEIAMAA